MESYHSEPDGEHSVVIVLSKLSSVVSDRAHLNRQGFLTTTPGEYMIPGSARVVGMGTRQPRERASTTGNTRVARASAGQPQEGEMGSGDGERQEIRKLRGKGEGGERGPIKPPPIQ